MDKIQELYNLYLEQGLITEATSIDDFRMASGGQQGQLFELGKSNGLFETTTSEQFSSAWGEVEPLKKKDISESQLEDGGSVPSGINQPTQEELQEMLDNASSRERVGQNVNEDRYVNPIRGLGMYPEGGQAAVTQAIDQGFKDAAKTLEDDKINAPAEAARKLQEEQIEIEQQQKYEVERQAILKSPEFEVALQKTNGDAINQDEDDAVGYFSDLYSRYGFSFRKTGLGDAMVVYPPNASEPLDVDLDTFFSDDKEASALREYVKANAVTPTEVTTSEKDKDNITRATKARTMRSAARINKDGTESTVLMASGEVDGKYVAYPTLFPSTEGMNEKYGSDPSWWSEKKGMEAFKEAKKRGEVFEFDTEEEAMDFAEGSWKDVNTVDSEANDFFRDKGYNYSEYKKNIDRYEEIRDELYFLEEANYRKKDLTPEEQEKYSNFYVNGVRRNQSVEDRIAELNAEQDQLYSVVNDTDLMTAREDFDLHIDKSLQVRVGDAVSQNDAANNFIDKLNEESLQRFNVTPDKLYTIIPRDEMEAYTLDQLNSDYVEAKALREQAADKYQVATTFLDAKFDENIRDEFVENWSSVTNAAVKGTSQGNVGNEILKMSLGLTDLDSNASSMDAAKAIIQYMQDADTGKQGRAEYRWHSARGFRESWSAFKNDPIELGVSLAANSISQMLPYGWKIIGGATAAGAGTGALIGASGFVTGPGGVLTTGAGAISGAGYGFKSGMVATSFALEYTNAVLDAVTNQGFSVSDPESLKKALQSKEVWDEGMEIGLKRGIPIAIADLFSMQLAGRVFQTGALATRTARIGLGVTERLVFDPTMEGLGELAAQYSVGGEIDWKEVAAESIGGFGNQGPNAAVNMFLDGRARNNIEIANKFTNLKFLANEKYSDTRISTWANNMLKVGQISVEQNQRIQENLGLRREARNILSVGLDGGVNTSNNIQADPTVEARLMELLSAREQLSSTPNRKSAFADKISQINKEISGIAETKKTVELNRQTILVGTGVLSVAEQQNASDIRQGLQSYAINGKEFTKEVFLDKVSKLTKRQLDKISLTVNNDTEVGAIVDSKMADPKNFTTEKNKARIKRLGENATDAAGVAGKSRVAEEEVVDTEITEEVVTEEVTPVEEVVVEEVAPVEEVVTEEVTPVEEVVTEEQEVQDLRDIINGTESAPTPAAEVEVEEDVVDAPAPASTPAVLESIKEELDGRVEEINEEIASIKIDLKKDLSKKGLSTDEKTDLREDAKNEIDSLKEDIKEAKREAKKEARQAKKESKGGQFQLDGRADESTVKSSEKRKKALVKRATKVMEEVQPELSENNVEVEDTKAKTTTVVVVENSALADKVKKMGLKELIGKRINLVMADQLKVDENRMGGPFFPLMDKLFGKVAWASIGRVDAKKIVLGSIGADYSVVYNMSPSAVDSNLATLDTLIEKIKESPNSELIFQEMMKDIQTKKFKEGKTELVHRIARDSNTLEDFVAEFSKLDVDSKAQIFTTVLPSSSVEASTTVGKLFAAEGISQESIRAENVEQFVADLPMGAITMVLKVTDKQGKPVTKETVDEALISPEEQETEGLPKHRNYPWYVRGKAVGIMKETVPFWNLSKKFMSTINAKIDGIIRMKVGELVDEKTGKVKRKAGTKPTTAAQARGAEMKRAMGSSSNNFEVQEATNTTYQQFINRLSRAFPNTEVVATQEEFNNLVKELNAKELTTKSQKVYGAVYQGKLYLNPAAQNYNTPIHEFGHLWSNTAKAMNPELYNKGIELVKDSDYVTDIKNSKAYTKIVKQMKKDGATDAEIEQYVLEEALATAIGDQGAAFAEAAQKKNFKAWLSELFDLVKKLTGISNVTSEQLENMSLEDFTQAIVVDLLSENELFVGAEVEAQSQQLQLMVEPNTTRESIIEIARENGFTDASILVVLKENGYTKVAENKAALEVPLNLMDTFPREFNNVEGGANVGLQLFTELKAQLNKYATQGKGNNRTKTFSEIREEAQRLLKDNPIFQAQAAQTKLELLNAFDRSLGIRTNPKVSKEIAAIKNKLKEQYLGERTLAAAQRKMRMFIRKTMPKSKNYSISRMNKLIKTVNETTAKNFDGQVTKVMKELQGQRTLMKNAVIKKMIDLVKKKSQAAMTESKKRRSNGLDAIGQSYFVEVKKVLKLAINGDVDGLASMAKEVDQSELTKALDKMEQGKKLTRNERGLIDKQLAIDTYSEVMGMELEDVNDLYSEVLITRAESIARLNNRKEARRNAVTEVKEDFSAQLKVDYQELYDENGKPKNKPQLKDDRESIYRSFKDVGFFEGVKNFLSAFITNSKYSVSGVGKFLKNNLVHFGTINSLLDRGQNGMFTNTFFNKLNEFDENALQGMFRTEEVFDSMAQALSDSKETWRQWKNNLGTQKITITNLVNTKTDAIYSNEFNPDQALRLYALSKNDVQKAKLINQGFTEYQLQRIKDFIGTDGVKMVDLTVDYLTNEYYNQTNDVYAQANDVNLGFVDNYFPTRTLTTGVVEDVADMTSGDFNKVFTAENAPALKERSNMKSDLDPNLAFTEVVEQHIKEMERFKAYALGVKEMNEVLKSEEIQNVLQESGLKGLFNQSLNYAINPDAGPKVSSGVVSWVQSKFSGFALAFKAIQILKQATSFVQAYEDYSFQGGKRNMLIDVPAFAMDYAKVLFNLRREIKESKTISATFKNRLRKGVEGDVYGLESGGRTYKSLSNAPTKGGRIARGFKTAAGSATVAGDILGVLGYKAVYNRNIANGMSKAEALSLFNNFNSTQQSRRATEKVGLQRDTGFTSRFFTMFGSTLYLQMNKVGMSMNSMVRDAQRGKIPKAKDVRAFALNYAVANVLFTMAAYSGVLLKGDDKEKEEAWRAVRNSALGLNLIYQIPLVGSVMEIAINKATGNRKPVSEGVNPLTSVYRKVAKTSKGLKDGEIIKAAQPIVEIIIGAQLDAPIALGKVFAGQADETTYFELLGISPSYRPGYGVKKKSTKKKTVTNSGMSAADKRAFKKYDPAGYEERYGERDRRDAERNNSRGNSERDAERKLREQERQRERFNN